MPVEQALAGEAMQLLWALAEVNPRVLTAFEGANMELRGLEPQHGNTPWESVLVRSSDDCLISLKVLGVCGRFSLQWEFQS